MRTPARRHRRKKRSCSGCFAFILVICFSIIAFFLVKNLIIGYIDNMTESYVKKQYPLEYKSIVEKYAKQNNLDKYLVYAIIKAESKFDCYAVSNAGAYGLMQLQTETAEDCAKKLNIKATFPDDLYKADINIRIGTYYFAWLLKRYNNNVETAIVAYNSGIANADKWADSKTKKIDLDDIQFAETKSYIQKVLAYQKKYKEIYEQQP